MSEYNPEAIVKTFIEVKLKTENDFLKVKETLTRIGVASNVEKKLWQSVHLLHKKGKYYIVHFKQLYALDGKETDFSKNDQKRVNAIASLLEEWGLVKIVNPEIMADGKAHMSQIKVLPYKDRDEWELIPKYFIGRKKNYT